MGVLVPTSLVMHNFWDFAPSSPAHQIEFMNFVKVSTLTRVGAGGYTQAAVFCTVSPLQWQLRRVRSQLPTPTIQLISNWRCSSCTCAEQQPFFQVYAACCEARPLSSGCLLACCLTRDCCPFACLPCRMYQSSGPS